MAEQRAAEQHGYECSMSGCAFNPTPEQRDWVDAMIGCGMLEDEICRLIKKS